MKQQSFILGPEGFHQKSVFNSDLRKIEHFWVPNLSEAGVYTSKQARNLIEKHNLSAFIWQPLKEKESCKDNWKVCRRSEYVNFFDDNEHECFEWMAVKVRHDHTSDFNYLGNLNYGKKIDYYSFEDAMSIVKERNQLMLNDLKEKMGL